MFSFNPFQENISETNNIFPCDNEKSPSKDCKRKLPIILKRKSKESTTNSKAADQLNTLDNVCLN